MSDTWIGSSIGNGRYAITSKLGEGGMGAVYCAWDSNLQTEVVVKVPHATRQQDPEATARFVREASSLVKLSHPHVVKIIDFGEQGGQPFAVMQFLSGGSLATRQDEIHNQNGHRRQPPESLKDWLPSIAKALDFVHSQGYLHRDVKPANILFDAHGNAFLSDFGITKFAVAAQAANSGKSLTGAGMVVGTPEYMAPEIILGQSADGRLDQYALAVTVFEQLAGRRPFEDATPTAVLVQQTTTLPPDIRSFNADVPPSLSTVIRQALAKNPAERFASCVAFSDAVQAAASGKSQSAKLKCPACQKSLRLEWKVRGRTLACPGCGAELKVAEDLSALALPTGGGSLRETKGGTRAVFVGDTRSRPELEPATAPAKQTPEKTHTDDFWEVDLTEAEGAPVASPTVAITTSEISTRPSRVVKQATQKTSKPSPSSSGIGGRTPIIIGSGVVALVLIATVAFLIARAGKNPKDVGNSPSTGIANKAPVSPTVPVAAITAGKIDHDPKMDVPQVATAASKPAPAIYDLEIEPPGTRLSVDSSKASITGDGSRRRVVVDNPKPNMSVTLIASADGFQELRRELNVRPGISETIALKLESISGSSKSVVDGRRALPGSNATASGSSGGTAPKQVPGAADIVDTFAGKESGQLRLDNGLNMGFVWIRPGEFKMGSEMGPDHQKNEHLVDVKLMRGFWLGKHEVTRAQWQRAMKTTPWNDLTDDLHPVSGDNYPATHIDWENAMAFCKKFTDDERAASRLPLEWEYSLPTEAQWEYGCRAGTTTPYYCGKAHDKLREAAWFKENVQKEYERHAQLVGSREPNTWGLYDMHGNVSEWCRDWYVTDAPGGTDPEVSSGSSRRVTRGGNWRSRAEELRSACRTGANVRMRSSAIGFRVVAVPGVLKRAIQEPGAEAQKAHGEAAQLFRQAQDLTRGANFAEARSALQKASHLDPESIAADFTLGLLDSIAPVELRSPKGAATHFRTVLQRVPGYVPALNNLAIAEIRQEKYADALRHLGEAAGSSSAFEEVGQNLGRFISEAKLGRIHPRKAEIAKATGLHAKLAKEGASSESQVGWRFIPFVSPDGERETLSNLNYHDRVCSACNGRGRLACRAQGCQHGYIHGEVLQNNPINIGNSRAPVVVDNITSTPVQHPCPTCRGTGYVKCPYCSGGVDPLSR